MKRSNTRSKGATGRSRAAAVMKKPQMSSRTPLQASSPAEVGHKKGWQVNLQVIQHQSVSS